MLLRIEGFALWVDLLHIEAAQSVEEAFQGQLYTVVQGLHSLVVTIAHGLQGPLQVVYDHEQLTDQFFLTEFMCFLDRLFRAALHVLHISPRTQYLIALPAGKILGFRQAPECFVKRQPLWITDFFVSRCRFIIRLQALFFPLVHALFPVFVVAHLPTLYWSATDEFAFRPIWGRQHRIQALVNNRGPATGACADML